MIGTNGSKIKVLSLIKHADIAKQVQEALSVGCKHFDSQGFDFQTIADYKALHTRVMTGGRFDILLWELSSVEQDSIGQVRALVDLTPDSPIIVIADSNDAGIVKQILDLGVQDYLNSEDFQACTLTRSIMRSIESQYLRNQLHQTSARFVKVQSLGQIGVWEFDLTTQITIWSDEVYRLYERDPELGPPSTDEEAAYYTPEQAQKLLDYTNKAISEGQPYDYDLIVNLPSGRQAFFAASMHPVINPAGKTTKLLGTVQNISDRKQAEQVYQHRLAELEVLYENSLGFNQLLEPQEIAQKLIEILGQKLAWHHAAIRLYHADTNRVELLALSKEYQQDEQIDRVNKLITSPQQGLSGWVIEHGTLVRCSNVKIDKRYIQTFDNIRSGLYVPLKIGTKVIGSIAIESQQESAFTEGDERFLTTLAAQSAIAIENARLYQEAQAELAIRKQTEAALLESKERYQGIFNGVQDAIVVESLEGMILDVNDAACQMYGYSPEEFRTKTIFDLAPEGLQPLLLDENGQGNLPELPVEVVNMRANGEIFEAEASGRLHHFGDHENVLLVVIRDISERKHAEETLRLQGVALEAAANAILITNAEGEVEWTNNAFCEMTGYTSAEIIGKSPRLLKFGMQEPTLYEELWETILQGQVWQGSLVNKRKDGSLYTEEMTITPVLEEQGRITNFIAIKQDISERIDSEETLRKSETKFRKFVERSQDAIILANSQGLIIDWNQSAEHLTGLKKEEVIEQPLWEAQFKITLAERRTEQTREHLKNMMAEFLTRRQAPWLDKLSTVEIQTPQGEIRVIQSIYFPIDTPQELLVGGIMRDITEQRKAEEALRQHAEQLASSYAETQRHLNELTLLQAVSSSAIHAENEDEVIFEFTQILQNALYSDHFGVLLVDEAQDCLRVHPSYRGLTDQQLLITFKKGEGITGRTWESAQTIRIEDIDQEPSYHPSTPNVQSEICVPLQVGSKVIGVINAESTQKEAFNQDDERLLTTLAGQIVLAIERLRKETWEREQRVMAEALRDTALTINSTLDSNEILDRILANLERVIPFESAAIYFVKNGYAQAVRQRGYTFHNLDDFLSKKSFIINEMPSLKELVHASQPVLISDTRKDLQWVKFPEAEWINSYLATPILIKGKTIGILALDHSQAGFFNQAHISILSSFSSQVAIALENARLYQSALRSAEQRTILQRVSQEIAASVQGPEEVYAVIHKAATRLMTCDAFSITLLKTPDSMKTVYLVDKDLLYPNRIIPLNDTLGSQVVGKGVSVYIDDLLARKDLKVIHLARSEATRSILAVPIQIGSQTIGMLCTQSYRPNQYSKDDQHILEMLAAHAGIAIENAELLSETASRLEEMEVINRISTSLRGIVTIEEMLPLFLEETLTAVHASAGNIAVLDNQTQLFNTQFTKGWFENLQDRLPGGNGIGGYVLETGQAYVTPDFIKDSKLSRELVSRIPAGWGGACLPIFAGQIIVALLYVSVELPRQISPDEIKLLSTLNEVFGNAIHRAQLFEQTEKRLGQLESLRTIDKAITASLDLGLSLKILTDQVIKQLEVDAADILQLNKPLYTLEYVAGSGFRSKLIENTRLSVGEGYPGQVVAKRATIRVNQITESDPGSKRAKIIAEEDFTAYHAIPLISKGQIIGVMELFNRTPLPDDEDWLKFADTLAEQASIAIENLHMFQTLQHSNMELAIAYDATLMGWVHTLDLRDKETEEHTQRVTEMSVVLAKEMGLKAAELVHIRRGALLHDVGKMGVPDRILHKAGPLDDDEWAIMRHHPVLAYELLSPIEYLRPAVDVPYCHHEKWDGSGYPRGLKGEQIPLAARIFAIVDVWDALSSDRPYRAAWSDEKVVSYLREQSGTHFDPAVVDTFLKLLETTNWRESVVDNGVFGRQID